MSIFRFRRFSVSNDSSAMKVNTDGVLLGAAMTLLPGDRTLLDIGTGTGVIALMAAQRLSDLLPPSCTQLPKIDAIDIDAASAAEAEANFAASPWPGWLSARHCPLSGYTPAGSIDLIFSNPPYFDNSLRNPDRRESAARHTDSLSWREICAFAAEHLTPEGRLALILPAECETPLRRTAASFGLYPFRLLRVRSTAAKAPSRLLAEFSRRREELREETLVLQEGPARTAEFAALTKDFYL